MAMALMAVSVIAGLAGSFAQASAMNAQADAQEKIANFNAQQQEIEANKRQGEAALRREFELREGEKVAGKARAAFAQAGVDTTSGTPLLLDQDIMRESTFRGELEAYRGASEGRTLREEAKGTRFEGAIRAAASRSQARASIFSGIGGAFSSMANFKWG